MRDRVDPVPNPLSRAGDTMGAALGPPLPAVAGIEQCVEHHQAGSLAYDVVIDVLVRLLAGLCTIATAVESYSIDNNQYPSASGATVTTIISYLEPTYIKKVPTEDGWNTAFQYVTDTSFQEYTLESFGKDGADTGPASGATTDFRHDIVFSTGSFVAYPDGTQG